MLLSSECCLLNIEFWLWWFLNLSSPCYLWIDRSLNQIHPFIPTTSVRPLNSKFWILLWYLVYYVSKTSEQVKSISILTMLTLHLYGFLFYGTQTVISILPLNRRVHNPVLLSPVGAGSSYCQVNTTTSEQRIASLVSLSRWCPYYLWTDGCSDPIHHCSP